MKNTKKANEINFWCTCLYTLVCVLMTFTGFVFWVGISICCEISMTKFIV